tara:strand:+ start:20247 stop:21959 length:1713 start_codon:yes stop_codon:yes gene_type:complete
MANLRTNNLSGEQGQNAYRGSVVFGGGDNSSAGLTIADNSDLELGSETNWTIEFWLWLNGPVHGDYDVILGKGSATGNNYEYFVEVMSDNTLDFFSTSTGSAWTFQQQISPVLSHDSWHHVAVVRNGSGSNSLKSYINGQEYGSFTAESIHTSAYPFGIGYFAGGNNLYSKVTVSNLRIVKGTSVYTAAFTPPFTELKAIPNTVLLCCQDSDNPFKEETGKTITGVGHLANGAVIHPRNNPPYGVDAGNTFGGPIQQSTQGYMYFPTGRTEERGRGRGVIFGGYSSPTGYTKDIYYIDIQSMGNAVHFGDITATRYSGGGCGSSTRGIIGGGRAGSDSNRVNIIEFVEIAITSNSLDFGDLTGVNAFNAGGGNQTRGIWMGGSTPTTVDTIEFVTIATKGDALDFGNLTVAKNAIATGASSTRMLGMGGGNPSQSFATIDLITIATTGNASDFGDLTAAKSSGTGVSSNTRAVAIGGVGSPAILNTMDFVTIATTGNATDFGDTLATYEHTGSVNNSIRGVITGARTPSYLNILEFITIATTGNSKDFGDIPRDNLAYVVGASDSHGGLS